MSNYLTKLLKNGESAKVAFFGSLDDEQHIAKAVCALLNSDHGGSIVVGVDGSGKATGSDISINEAASCESNLKTMISPKSLYTVALENHKASSILLIDIPPGSNPPYVVDGGIWMRSGTTIRPATRDDLNEMLAELKREVERWERRISHEAKVSDLDTELLNSTFKKAQMAGRLSFEENIQSIADKLTELSFSRGRGLTNAGDIAFSKRPDKRHPQTRLQLLEVAGDKADNEQKNSSWFEGPALLVARRVFETLQSYNRTQSRFSDGSIERVDQPAYSDFALREGIVNALAHRDYEAVSGGVKVTAYKDRIEIWNSGRLNDNIKISDLPKKHASFPNNPDIAHAFYIGMLMERTGRGGERIAESCREIGAPPPVWDQDHGGVTLTLYASLSPGEAIASELNDRQREFIETVLVGETLTAAEYHKRFASMVSMKTAQRELSELVKYRLVLREGASVRTRYRRI